MAFEKNIFEGTENSSCSIGPTVTYTGHLRREKNWKCPSHFHECAEVLFCVDGRGSVTIDGKEYRMKAGDIALFNPYISNSSGNCNEENFEFYFIGMIDFCYPPFAYNTLMPEEYPVFSAGPYKNQLEFYFQELIRETSRPETVYMPVVSALGNVIATQILRIYQLNILMEKDKAEAKSYSHIIKDYIDKNYHQAVNLDTLSEASFISKSYISHQFKKDMGMSPIDYLIKKRLEIARYLLTNTKYAVAEVAKQIGYDNPLYFSSLFKKNVGISPTEYRKNYTRDFSPTHAEAEIPMMFRKSDEIGQAN